MKQEDCIKLGSFIKNRRESLGYNLSSFAQLININKGDLSKLERGIKSKTPSPDILKKVAKGLEINYLKLYKIVGYVDDLALDNAANRTHSNAKIIPATEMTKIPVYSHVHAGDTCCVYPEPIEFIDIPYIKNGHQVIAIEVKGDCMEPRLFEGDLVVVRVDEHLEHKQIGVFVHNNETIVKAYNINEKGQIVLTSYNQDYFPIIINEHDDFHIVGRVFKVLQNV